MKIITKYRDNALEVICDEYGEEVTNLKYGKEYRVTISSVRCYEFHKKYFSLIKFAWENISEEIREHYKQNKEGFRKTLEITAGYYEEVYSMHLGGFVQVPKSIAFTKMNAEAFQQLYNNVLDVILMVYFRDKTEEDINELLKNYS